MHRLSVLLILVGLLFPGAAYVGEQQEPLNPEAIYNYHQISESLGTAGQVYPVQVPWLVSENYELVINLAVASEERNLEESYHITSTGMSYMQIPVIWDTPTEADLNLFFAVMDGRGERKTLVHCYANYRASAFTYLYRVIREGVPEIEAREDLHVIWNETAFQEYSQWRTFINQTLAADIKHSK